MLTNGFLLRPVRFILNCPAETARDEMMILMFEVEKAFWFYLDFWREHDASLPPLNMRDFSKRLFCHCAMLQPYAVNVDIILAQWNNYKREVPTYGAVILDESLSKVLLVRGWNSKSWGWPKGKVNKNEDHLLCAAREVQEEVGVDVSGYLSYDRVISLKVGEVVMKLFVAPGVPENTYFETQTRKEISEIKWFPIKTLRSENGPKMYSVTPVLGRLQGWIADYKRSMSRSRTPERKGSPAQTKKSGKKGKQQAGGDEGRMVPTQETDAAGVSRNNEDTFGGGVSGFSVEDMFRVNEEKFGITSSYSFDHYTTKLPGSGSSDEAAGAQCMYAERYRPMAVAEDTNVQTKIGQVGEKKQPEAAASSNSSGFGFSFDASAIMGAMTF